LDRILHGIWTQKLKRNACGTLQRRPEKTFGLVSVILFALVLLKKQLRKKQTNKKTKHFLTGNSGFD